MDDTVNRLAKELAQAIAAAVASDPNVEACRAKARAAGYELHLSIDAEVGFASRTKSTALVKSRRGPGSAAALARKPISRELSASDRLFLKSLRIAPDEIPEVKS
ncbi:MAG TPA: hypothetical protein VIL35_08095 [Vicinamibacterales bacterium]